MIQVGSVVRYKDRDWDRDAKATCPIGTTGEVVKIMENVAVVKLNGGSHVQAALSELEPA